MPFPHSHTQFDPREMDSQAAVRPASEGIVVVPLAVNLMTNAVTALVGKLMARLRPEQPDQPDLEIAELTQANGDRVVFVRLQGKHQ